MIGLTDYANAVVHTALVQQHSTFVHWYDQIYPRGRELRLLTMLAVVAAMASAGTHWRGPSPASYRRRRPGRRD